MPPRRRTSPPELLDATSNLLSVLHLNGMSQTGSDPVLEVPDSPDRPARVSCEADLLVEVPDSPEQSPSGWRNPRRSRRAEDSDTHLGGGSSSAGRSRRAEDSDTHLGGGSSSAGNDAERMRKLAGLKRLISKALDTKASPESPCRKIAKTVDMGLASPVCISSDSQSRGPRRENRFPPPGETVKHIDGDKGVDLITDPQEDVFPTMGQSCLGINGGLSRCNRGKSIIQSEVDGRKDLELLGGGTSSSLSGISDQDMSRHYDFWMKHTSRNNAPNTSLECVGEGLPDRISIASSEADAYTVDRNKGKFKMDDNSVPDRISIASSEADAYTVDRNKGKLKMDDNSTQSRLLVKAKARPDRERSRSDKDVTVISDGDEAPISVKDLGWRTTPNHTRTAQSYSSDVIVDAFKKEHTNNHLSEQSYEVSEDNQVSVNLVHDRPELDVSDVDMNANTIRASSESESAKRRHRRQQILKRKEQYNSLRSISGESSSSVFQDLNSSGQDLNSSTTLDFHDRGTFSGPVIDLDEEHSPERFSSPQEQSLADDYLRQIDDYSRQVEADEILARRLQEQFYQESSGPGGMTETDVTIAWSLQEEDARRPAPITRSYSQLRDASMAHLYSDHSRSSVRSSLQRARAYAQLANLAQASTSGIQAQLRRALNSPEMDLETRFEFLEALDNVLDDNNDAGDFNFQTQRDFNEYDYEMLLALDDHNHEHAGATDSQINRLPHSVIQVDGISEACTICLDPPGVGDVVRHLPCLHKFHKDCIDTWLRRKAACPICKSVIT